MNGLEWTDELKLELIRLKSELNPQNLEVINKGIGVGTFKKVTKPKKQAQIQGRLDPTTQAQAPRYQMPYKKQNLTRHDQTPPNTRSRYVPQKKWAMRMKVLLFDLFFTVMSLFIGALSLMLVIDYERVIDNRWELWSWSTKLGPYGMLVGFVAMLSLYLLYRLCFKTLLGKTLGEALVERGVQVP